MQLIDSHCHLDDPRFDVDRRAVLLRAAQAGVVAQLLPAVSAARWPVLKDVLALSDGLYAAYGLHPMFIDQHKEAHLDQLQHWLAHEKPLAVGECGLDFFIKELDQTAQLHFFHQQLDLAVQFNLPVVIHARKSVDQVLRALRQRPTLTGVCHCFSGSEQQAKQLIERGFKLGFGGPITYPRALKLRRLVKLLPLEALLLESDAPDQPDQIHWGERNEPAYLSQVVQTVAELRSIEQEQVASVTTNSARQLFQF
ncbi:MAG: TatD family hydrolase [Gammaproteobacteria bacterium]|nr:TatD family hydrolase [Gammaproteobacteria bacterium]